MPLADSREASSSQLSLASQDLPGPPTPPKDAVAPGDSRSSTPASGQAVLLFLDPSEDPSGTMSTADSLRPSTPAHLASNPGADQTETSITHQSSAGDSAREKDTKDKGSWAASTFTMPVKGRHARRKSGKAGASNGKGLGGVSTAEILPSTPTSSEGRQSSKRRRKISLFERIAFACVCCISPSPRTHDIDIEEGASRESEPKDPEKQLQETNNNKEAEPQSPSPHAPDPSSSTSTTATSAVASPPAFAVAPPVATSASSDTADTEISVVVPPTPTRQLLPLEETDGLTSGAVQPPGSTGDEIKTEVRVTVGESDDSDEPFDDEPFVDGRQLEDWEDEEQRLIRQGGAGIPLDEDGRPQPLLPMLEPKYAGRKCLVLDLDETLVHSSLKPVPAPDYVVPVEIENNWHNFYVLKRPGVDNFLRKMGELYEVVVFTASLSKYADPVLDRLDPTQSVAHRLFRESCYNHRGNYVKDLSQLGRPVGDTIILDNSPASYIFHPHNAVPVSSWFNDPHDTELTDLCPFLEDLSTAQDVRGILNPFVDIP